MIAPSEADASLGAAPSGSLPATIAERDLAPQAIPAPAADLPQAIVTAARDDRHRLAGRLFALLAAGGPRDVRGIVEITGVHRSRIYDAVRDLVADGAIAPVGRVAEPGRTGQAYAALAGVTPPSLTIAPLRFREGCAHEVLSALERGPATVEQLRIELGRTKATVYSAVLRLVELELVAHVGHGQRVGVARGKRPILYALAGTARIVESPPAPPSAPKPRTPKPRKPKRAVTKPATSPASASASASPRQLNDEDRRELRLRDELLRALDTLGAHTARGLSDLLIRNRAETAARLRQLHHEGRVTCDAAGLYRTGDTPHA